MRLTPSFAMLTALGCASTAPPPAPLPPEAVRHVAGQHTYIVIEHRRVEQRYQDRPIVTEATVRAVVTVDLAPTDSGYALQVVVDSAGLSGDAGMSPAVAAGSLGARFTAQLTPTGTARDWHPPEPSNPLLDQLAFSVRDLIVPLPGGGLSSSDRWEDTTRLEGRAAGLPVQLEARAVHEAGSWNQQDPVPVLPVVTRATYEMQGEGERTGQWLVLTGTGARVLERRLDPTGALTFGVRADTLRLQVEVGNTGLTIPVLQVRADTIRRALP
jgi:hypothetical protein